MEFQNFNVPFSWGVLYDLTNIMGYAWSTNSGNLAGVAFEA